MPFLCNCMFMCLGAVVVVDCVMWYGMLFVLFCVCVCCLVALFACVIRLWYVVRCCIVWCNVLRLCVCVHCWICLCVLFVICCVMLHDMAVCLFICGCVFVCRCCSKCECFVCKRLCEIVWIRVGVLL